MLFDGVVRDAPCTEAFEPGDFLVDGRGLDVEVHAVLSRFGFSDTLHEQLGLLSRRVDEQHVVARAARVV